MNKLTMHTYGDIPGMSALYLRVVIEKFANFNPAYNIAHSVLSDMNLDDGAIEFCLKYIPENREEAKRDHGYSDDDINQVEAFLRFLLTIPEETRDGLYGKGG